MTDEESINKISLEGEIWKDVVGYEGIYKVSSLGRVMNVLKAERRVPFYILRPAVNKNQYLSVELYKNKKKKRMYIHRIVAIAFIENPNEYSVVDHINAIRYDNRVENLRWSSIKNNLNNPITRLHISQSNNGTYMIHEPYKKNPQKKPKRSPYIYSPILSTEEYLQKNSIEGEVWKSVVGKEEYLISNFGRCISLPKKVRKGISRHKFLKQSLGSSGYYRYCLNKKIFPVHRLIAMAFIPNPEKKPNVDHINTIRTDNRIENLRWVTQKENINNPKTISLMSLNAIGRKQTDETILKRVSKIKGKKRNAEMLAKYKKSAVKLRGKKVLQFTKDMKFLKEYETIHEADRQSGISFKLISSCCNKKQKTAGGYIWKLKASVLKE